jgi:hypothetical protein
LSPFVRSNTPSPRLAARPPGRAARVAFLACVLGAVTLPARAQDCLALADVTPVGEGTPGIAGVPELLAVGAPALGSCSRFVSAR